DFRSSRGGSADWADWRRDGRDGSNPAGSVDWRLVGSDGSSRGGPVGWRRDDQDDPVSTGRDGWAGSGGRVVPAAPAGWVDSSRGDGVGPVDPGGWAVALPDETGDPAVMGRGADPSGGGRQRVEGGGRPAGV